MSAVSSRAVPTSVLMTCCPILAQHCAEVLISVLTVHIACFLLTRLLVLVERELAGKQILFTLVIEGLLRKRRKGKAKEKKRRGRGLSNVHMEKIKDDCSALDFVVL